MKRLEWLMAMVVAIPTMAGAQPVLTRAELITLMKQSGPAAWSDDTAAQLRALIPESTTTSSFGAKDSTATATDDRFSPTRCGGFGAIIARRSRTRRPPPVVS